MVQLVERDAITVEGFSPQLFLSKKQTSDKIMHLNALIKDSLKSLQQIQVFHYVLYSDGGSVSQVEELIAVPGEEMIVPCHYRVKTPGEVQQVSWYTGDDIECLLNIEVIYTSDPKVTDNLHRFSLVNFPEDVSLRIHSVQRSEYQRFCCFVTTSHGEIYSRIGTELIITGSPSPSPFTVTQPYNITGHRGQSVTLNCSYSSYMESDVLGVNIYWRLGNISGPYVYHPYKEMVYPGYSGRTEITGAADLHIQRLEMSDDSMYYCFVMVKLCTGNRKYENIIQYGEGTRLIVTDHAQTESHLYPPTVIFVSYIGFKFFVALVLFILALVCYKDI
ncbi:uncharacterized protein LOC142750573 [Rhinoderma darwinii]|uniref:uncharacterized protein LOC142750573 n=1 Tax=Rhinoderma darwinii TaxID=43563 RepID=UPI003F6732EE